MIYVVKKAGFNRRGKSSIDGPSSGLPMGNPADCRSTDTQRDIQPIARYCAGPHAQQLLFRAKWTLIFLERVK